MDEILTVFENNHIEPPWSHVFVLGLDVVAIVAIVWCVQQMLAAKRAAEQARRIERSTPALFEGLRFVAGQVEVAEGTTFAIRVTLTQEGTQRQYKNQTSHRWTEVDREIEAVPFYLRLESGERIRVEPPSDVQLVDKLDQMEWYALTRRRKRAALTAEERAIVEGFLTRGTDPESRVGASYRTNTASSWIMKPTKKRGMQVSVEGLARRHELRARAFAWKLPLVLLFCLGSMICSLPYRERLFFGKNVVCDYLGKETYQTRNSKGHVQTHFAARVRVETQSTITNQRFDVDSDDYAELPNGPRKIWVRMVPRFPEASALGKNSSIASWQLILATVVLGLGVYRIVRTHQYRRWYEGPVVEEGTGPLPTPPAVAFVEPAILQVPAAGHPKGPPIDRITVDFTNDVSSQG